MNVNPIFNNKYYYFAPAFKNKAPVRTNVLKELKNINCVYCGEKMLTYNQVDDYSTKASKLTGQKLYKFLSILEPHMKKREKAVLRVIKQEIKKYPKLHLQGVLQKMFPYHLKKLEKQQKTILKQIAKESRNFSENDKNLTLLHVYKGLVSINRHDNVKHFKLNEYINDFYNIKNEYENIDNFTKIENVIYSMPTTHTNIDAFVVKYSRKSSKEIVERLLKPSQLTIEHLHPRSLGGTNIMSNIVLACGDDNSKRSSKPLDTMPNLRINIHNYFRSLRLAMAKKIPIQDCLKVEEYILSIQNTINSMLSEPIKFDNSKGKGR